MAVVVSAAAGCPALGSIKIPRETGLHREHLIQAPSDRHLATQVTPSTLGGWLELLGTLGFGYSETCIQTAQATTNSCFSSPVAALP